MTMPAFILVHEPTTRDGGSLDEVRLKTAHIVEYRPSEGDTTLITLSTIEQLLVQESAAAIDAMLMAF